MISQANPGNAMDSSFPVYGKNGKVIGYIILDNAKWLVRLSYTF